MWVDGAIRFELVKAAVGGLSGLGMDLDVTNTDYPIIASIVGLGVAAVGTYERRW